MGDEEYEATFRFRWRGGSADLITVRTLEMFLFDEYFIDNKVEIEITPIPTTPKTPDGNIR